MLLRPLNRDRNAQQKQRQMCGIFKNAPLVLSSPFVPGTLFVDLDGYEEIYQIDLVPTLSALLNLPIPQNSLGVLSTSILEPFLSLSDILDALSANGRQLFNLLQSGSSHRDAGLYILFVSGCRLILCLVFLSVILFHSGFSERYFVLFRFF